MKKREKIKKSERLEISILLNKGYSHRSIAKVLNRSNGSISREIRVNSVSGIYDPHKAETKISWRRTHIKKDWKKIDQNKKLRVYITNKLKLGWNPKEISGRMRLDNEPFYASKSAIYEWLRSARGVWWCRYLYSKRYYKKKKKINKVQRVMIPNRVGIQERNVGADNRSRYGHWEADAIVSGKRGSGALSVSQERKSKLVDITHCVSMSPKEHVVAHKSIISKYKILTMTFDNGIENKHHEQLRVRDVCTYFCDPYSSWQKGGVENVNKMIRRYIPKGSNISRLPVEYIQYIQDRLNNKPRAILGYKTPFEVATKAGIIR